MTASEILSPSTHSAPENEQLSPIYDMLRVDDTEEPEQRYYLMGPVGEEPVELPREIYEVLRHAVEAMKKGLSVTISPTSQVLTSQQAADLLRISRPTLIKALDEGKLPFTRSGTHRRIALYDVLEYRERRKQEQYAALDAMSVDVDENTDVEETLQELRVARKAVAARRRSGQVD